MSQAKPQPKPLPKRFYAAANLQHNGASFTITLDGKNVKTPAQKLLHTAREELALRIAAEWNAQAEFIDTDSMPLTRLLNITLDRAPLDRAAWLEEIARYCETDLLYYREPVQQALIVNGASRELHRLQLQHFTPVLEWCSKTYGITFTLTQGVMPVSQPAETLAALSNVFAAASDSELTALAMMIPLLGSALLALALWKGVITLEEAINACRLDETVQAAHWGEDPETVARWQPKARDIAAAAFFLTHKHL